MQLTLVTGGAGSGKSEYAERLLTRCPCHGRRIYLATMRRDENPETLSRIARHRRQREGLGLVTLEQERDIPALIRDGRIRCEDAVLLEDLTNLLANETFVPDPRPVQEVLEELRQLADACGRLVVVCNDLFADGELYDAETMRFLRNLSFVQESLAALPGTELVRVVCGIPVTPGSRTDTADGGTASEEVEPFAH